MEQSGKRLSDRNVFLSFLHKRDTFKVAPLSLVNFHCYWFVSRFTCTEQIKPIFLKTKGHSALMHLFTTSAIIQACMCAQGISFIASSVIPYQNHHLYIVVLVDPTLFQFSQFRRTKSIKAVIQPFILFLHRKKTFKATVSLLKIKFRKGKKFPHFRLSNFNPSLTNLGQRGSEKNIFLSLLPLPCGNFSLQFCSKYFLKSTNFSKTQKIMN